MGHPEVPWPLYDRLTSPKGGGGNQATRQGGKALSLYCACLRAHITDNFIYLERMRKRKGYI